MDFLAVLNMLTSSFVIAQAEMTAGAGEAASQWATWGENAAIVFAIFLLPFIIGHFVAKAVRMPTHASKIGFMLAAIFAAFIFSYKEGFQLRPGIDMKGGTNMVYAIEPPKDGAEKIDAGALASALNDRLNPSGTQDILIRPMGDSQIEVVVPETDPMALQTLKDRLTKAGALEFRIVANTRDHGDIIAKAVEQAKQDPPKTDVLAEVGVPKEEQLVIGRWYRVGTDAEKNEDGVNALRTNIVGDVVRNAYTGEILTDQISRLSGSDSDVEKYLLENDIQAIDVLMAFQYAGRPFAVVQGDDLSNATTTFNKTTGQPEISFSLSAAGGVKMTQLTGGINTSDETFKRRMAIIMDGNVLSAPQLNSAISSQGVIQGNFALQEVEEMVNVLRAGRLPATLSDKTISEDTIGAGLGQSTITKGTTASAWAVAATLICILIYYRFAGVVAAVALIINGLLIFGIMILIRQPLTLPGLAGLVLTVGMSVDANVLIFERIREEKNKGSAPRMSIRNGFDRAFTTIIDSNLTTLIAAVVLYWIGTDQVRGFAVALIIGIATSMFTATFCSRIIFEICEKLKLVSLSMSDGVGLIKNSLLGVKEVNFMGAQKLSLVFSIALIVAGIAAVVLRGKDILNIDFTGGTSVAFQLTAPMEADELRAITKKILADEADESPVQSSLVKVEKEPFNTVYKLVTSIQDRNTLAERVLKGFESEGLGVVTYEVAYSSKGDGASLQSSRMRFVSFQQDATEADAAADASSDSTDAGGDQVTTENDAAPAPAPRVFSEFELTFAGSDGESAEYSAQALKDVVKATAKKLGIAVNEPLITVIPDPRPTTWTPEDVAGHSTWKLRLPLAKDEAEQILSKMAADLETTPKWLSLSTIQGRVANEMQNRAIGAILVSLIFIVAYIWFRFQKVAYGLAAVVALVHDVLITLGVIALCHWLSGPLGFLLIDDFKIGLTEVAAFLTIIGYSLNDTIVVFDRIREVRGRSPRLTEDMVNTSVNQTLSRTLLTSGTTLLTVLLLYIFGGEGIHAFAFALLIGVLVGTYSSIFVASPVLLWITNRENSKQPRAKAA
ncbi:MAG: protein translocase subunit SecD [Aureliella sp.]